MRIIRTVRRSAGKEIRPVKKKRREPIVLSQMHPFTLFLVLSGCIILTFAMIHIDIVAGFFKRIFDKFNRP